MVEKMSGSNVKNTLAIAGLACLFAASRCPAASDERVVEITTSEVPWQQVDREFSFRAFPERERFSNLDRAARVIFAVQTGKRALSLAALSVEWELRSGAHRLVHQTSALTTELTAASIALDGMAPGSYEVHARLVSKTTDGQLGEVIDEDVTHFRLEKVNTPPQSGRIPLILPNGLPLDSGSFPIQCGIPFPKGALWNKDNVRLLAADGTEIPCQTVVRSRWGHHPESSIRWLGLDFQATAATTWWPARKDHVATLEFGPSLHPTTPPFTLSVKESNETLNVNTGPLQFSVKKQGFNLFNQVTLQGKEVIEPASGYGSYLIDHQGAVYRAANDQNSRLTIEEQTDLRVVIRAEGWYVKDGTTGELENYTLPTDKLCKFITRIEAYAGKPYVRILHTWVLTYDSFSVRLRDVGISLPLKQAASVTFGVEEEHPMTADVTHDGVYLIQQQPHAFSIKTGLDQQIANGRHSAGWATATHTEGLVTVSHRETWQRYPKEFEVLPDAMKLHVWPAHGREGPDTDPFSHAEIHKLRFAHEGRELNLAQPWETYFAVADIVDDPGMGVYNGAGLAMAGIHASAMGTAITSDILMHFGEQDGAQEARQTAECFQAVPHALAAPEWSCATEAFGWVHPYDPEHFEILEKIIEDVSHGYWEIGNEAGEYGMWLYRVWHHNGYLGDRQWELYRLYNASHHYEAFMPWLFYARSGDPFYLTQGLANIRQLSDLQTLHFANPDYPQKEFHFGQGRLIGSMKHTNGFNTWGGDHAVFSHQTCYNAMIMAYYLTGDLRLREVVNEWQRTITSDRANPEFARADRSLTIGADGAGARDNANAMGELMDLYQMTYHPALLALMAPMVDLYLNQPKAMSTWGQPLHNLLSFYGSQQAADQVLAAAAAARTTADNPEDPHSLWVTHCKHEVLALASLLAPEKGYHVESYFATDPAARSLWAARFRAHDPQGTKFCTIPDYLLYLPRVMQAVTEAGSDVTMDLLSGNQSLPGGDWDFGGWMRCIIREDVDQDIPIRFSGVVGQGGEGGFPVRIADPNKTLVLAEDVPEGSHSPFVLTIPKDGITGQYVIFFKTRDNKDKLLSPLTSLPEVYHAKNWNQNGPTRFFVRSRDEQPYVLEVGPLKGKGAILDRKGTAELAVVKTSGEPMHAEVGPDGVWLTLQCRYVNFVEPITVAISPERWFAPDLEKLNWKPLDIK